MAELCVSPAIPGVIPAERSLYSAVRRTRWAFLAALLYLVSQWFMIPIAPIGINWTLWPRFADIAWALMMSAYLLGGNAPVMRTSEQRQMMWLLAGIFAGIGLSTFCYYAFGGKMLGVLDGVYSVFRMAQFLSLFFVFTAVPLTPARLKTLNWLCGVALVLTNFGVLATYFRIIPLGALTAHLPSEGLVSGPWSNYARLQQFSDVSQGLGTICYNHSYTGAQLLLLLALRYHLSESKHTVSNALLMLLTVAGVLLCESRTGFATLLFFCATQLIARPRMIAVAVPVILLIAGQLDYSKVATTLSRQSTVLSIYEGGTLSGRPEIWKMHIRELNKSPLRWIVGGGAGSNRTYGSESNGHNMYIEFLSEFGLVGLGIFLFAAVFILTMFYKAEAGTRPLFWGTMSLLISGLTQDTFAIVPSSGHLVGFFLFCLAIGIRYRHVRQD